MLRQRREWRGLIFSLAAGGLALPLAAQEPESKELNHKLDRPSLWDQGLNLRTAAGYKDNVNFSAVNPQASPFLASGLDLMVFRLPSDGAQFSVFLTGEDIRYLGGGAVDKEQSASGQIELKKDFTPRWQAVLDLDYLYQNEVFDTSLTEIELSSVRAKGHRLSASPSLRYDFATNYYATAGLAVNRQYLEAPLDDYWEGGPTLSLGRIYGHGSSLALTYLGAWRAYDHRNQTTEDGTLLPGSRLRFATHQWALELEHNWDRKKHWLTTTRAGMEWNTDNGAGYFDYTRYGVSQTGLYRAGTWECSLQARLNYYAYPVQSVSLSDLRLRHKTMALLRLRGEKKLTRVLRLFAEFEYERSLGNTDFDRYQVNSLRSGLELEF